MIISKLLGGLGNQMFQYAVGMHLAYKLKMPYYLDIDQLNRDTLRNYELNHFNISASIASEKNITSFPVGASSLKQFFNSRKYVVEEELNYNPHLLDLKKPSYLEGYWQSEKYFHEIREIIGNEFVIISPLSDQTLAIEEELHTSYNCVGVHFRRGDYVANAKTNKVHGICSLDYYESAINHFREKYSNLKLYIFSDDIDWVKENLKVNVPVSYVHHNDAEHAYQDLYLMSQCKHQIIANSSFSWWAAWLNSNENKEIVAPSKWFVDTNRENQAVDIVPESWLRL